MADIPQTLPSPRPMTKISAAQSAKGQITESTHTNGPPKYESYTKEQSADWEPGRQFII